MIKEIVILVDYRRHFYFSIKNDEKEGSMDAGLVKEYFKEKGYSAVIKKFREVNFKKEDYRDKYILYQSTEDRGLHYKDYIEDILLGLKTQGAILIPDFHLFRAHHNKAFMEILRDLSQNSEAKNIPAKGYGSFEDFFEELDLYPGEVVIKPAASSTGRDIRLLKSRRDKIRYGKMISSSFNLKDALKNLVKFYLKNCYVRKSNYRRKFIIQEFVPDLRNDYKILVFGEKYYVLYRGMRRKDFRASGSGLFKWTKDLPGGLLDFTRKIFDSFDAPYISIDVGFNGKEFFLFEFQFVHFGTLTLEKAPFYFIRENGKWVARDESSILEKEFTESAIRYIDKREEQGRGFTGNQA